MTKQIATKQIVVNGQSVTVRVFAPKAELRERIDRARQAHNFEVEAEARAEAAHQGVDLGCGYSPS